MPIGLIAGNWKMNTTLGEARDLVAGMVDGLDAVKGVERVVCPPFVSLATVAEMLRGTSVRLGAQNMHDESKGAYTGEISPAMLVELCQYVILGHSERRQLLGETDAFINRKVRAALSAGLTPILCVGEGLEDREQGRADEVIEAQLRGCLVDTDAGGDLVVAYEPVWAIGTGRAATPDVAQDTMARIRAVLSSLQGTRTGEKIPLLYGGSVNPDNVAEFVRQPDVNGALVGGASLDAESFVSIARAVAEAAG